MEIKITKINPLSAALAIAAIALVIIGVWTIFAVICLLLGMKVDTQFNSFFSVSATGACKWLLLFATPFLSYITTFISTYAVCVVYNFVTPYTGPITVTKDDGNIIDKN